MGNRAMPPLRLSLIAACLSMAALAGCESTSARALSPAPERVIPVSLTRVEKGPLVRTIRVAGVLKEKRELDLSFKVPGVVSRVLVEEGARVRRGQLLAVLDPTEVEAGAAQAQEAFVKAQRDLQRARQLHENDGIPRSALDDANSAVVVARASATSASFNLKHAQLVAPDDGVIDTRMVEVGEIVAPGVPVLHFKSGLGSVVRVGLIDRDVLSVSRGQTAEVRLDARPEAPFLARVTGLASSITKGAGTFEVELTPVDRKVALSLPSGLSAKVTFSRAEQALSLPLTSLVDGDGEHAFVFVLEGSRAKRVPVEIAGIEGERVALRSQLADGVSVVALGAAELSDGARVRVGAEQ
jgi:multidrug efflux system membrane fusion protein